MTYYTEKQERNDKIEKVVNKLLHENLLAECSSYYRNDSDTIKVGKIFKIGCTKIDFTFYLEECNLKISELQVIISDLFDIFF